MADVDGELQAALTATAAFMELLVKQRAELMAMLASGERLTPEQLAELRTRHEADERELERSCSDSRSYGR